MKKGESISMNLIIIAAIALLVLVVLAVMIMKSGNSLGRAGACEGAGGACKESCNPDYESRDFSKGGKFGGCQEEQSCCIPLIRNEE